MPTRQRARHVRKIVDLLALDREERPILIGEVEQKGEPAGAALARIRDFLEFADLAVPFVMIVDPVRIAIYRAEEGLQEEPIFSTKTRPILAYYSGESPRRTVSSDFIRGMVLGWLQDLSYRWKSKTDPPPACEELERIGLAQLLREATFDYEVAFGGYRLSRDEFLDRGDPRSGT